LPRALRRFFGGGEPTGSPRVDALAGLRGLAALLRRRSERQQVSLAIRLLGREPFVLVLAFRVQAGGGSAPRVRSLGGKGAGLDLAAICESLQSRISPLQQASGEEPLWFALCEEPFGPGSAFLRKFGLATALLLPLPAGSEDGEQRYLLLATRAPLSRLDGRVREVELGWSIHRLVHRRALSPDHDQAGPGTLWEEAPAALVIVSGDEIRRLNAAARALLCASLGEDPEGWRVWLVAALRRLEIGGRDREMLLASRKTQRALELVLGPELGPDSGRLLALRDATAELQADTRQTETIRMLSHELRTPLTSMKSSVGLVLRGEAGQLRPQQEHFLAMTLRNIDRLDRLLQDLLDVSRAVAGRLELRREVVDLAALLREALDLLAASAHQQGVMLRHEELPAAFLAHVDPDKVIQMVHNTVGNALKFTDRGGQVRIVLCETEELPPLAAWLAEHLFLPLRAFLLEVADDGVGMAEEDMRHLFRPFERGRQAEASRRPGSGLGLHITRALVEAHGGTITIESSPQSGTRVHIVLPRDPASERVLGAARHLDRACRALGGEARLVLLDARPGLERGEPEEALRRSERTVRGFLERLIAAEEADGPRPMSLPGDPSDGAAAIVLSEIVSPAPGVWVAVLSDTKRLQPAWEVEKARPGCPELLAGSTWEDITPPDGMTVDGGPADASGAAPPAPGVDAVHGRVSPADPSPGGRTED
jgi:signal transduction histidine kinase